MEKESSVLAFLILETTLTDEREVIQTANFSIHTDNGDKIDKI